MNDSQDPADRPRIVLDTDMATDCDDAGALAVLHALASRGEAEIAATVTNNCGARSIGVVAAINAFYGRPDIPLGAYQGDTVGTATAPFFDEIATDVERYDHAVTSRDEVVAAVERYRRVLADDAGGITIVSIGHLNNLAALLDSDLDAVSPLGGHALVTDRVDQLVVMGGQFPSGTEHNFAARGAVPTTRAVLERWPTSILFAGYELGTAILTGPGLTTLDEGHPVRRAYAGHPADPLSDGRPSWDQTAVLAAVRGARAYWSRSDPGRVTVADDGSNTWTPDPDGPHRFLIQQEKPGPDAIAAEIESLMTASPDPG